MKKKILILVSLIIVLGFLITYLNESKAKDRGGRCTGSASCSACKNCSRCAHCSNGGTCGVCAGSSSSYNTNYSTHSSNSSTHKTTSSSSHKTTTKKKKANHSVVRSYTVKTAILNIRKEPTKLSEILCVVKKKHKIKILKSHNEFWYLVEASCGGKRIKGFVTKGSVL